MLNTEQVQEKFKLAIDCHRKGEIAQAQSLYAEVLADAPDHVDALHLLGVTAAQTSNHRKAVELIGKAIALRPGNPAFHCNQGIALNELKEFDAAVKCFDKAVAIKPDYHDAHFSCGNALQELGKFDEALESYDKAIAIKPDYPEALYLRGNALQKLGQYEQAVASYDQAVVLKPELAEAYSNRAIAQQELKNFDKALAGFDQALALTPEAPDLHFNRGVVLQELRRFNEAIASYSKAIAIKPDYHEACYRRGVALQELKQFDEALASFDQATAIKPDFAEAWSNQGNALQELKRIDQALACYDRAIAVKPDYHEAYYNRGVALKELKRIDDALESYHNAIAIKPDYYEAYYNRGNALQEAKQFVGALESFRKAIAIKPDYHEAYSNLGILFEELKQLDQALGCFDKAIAIKPDYTNAYWNKSLTLLLGGNFRAGWELYEWRWINDQFISPRREFIQPLWLGKLPIDGKTILLHSEQGLGDTLQLCRYIPMVAALGARVIFEVEESLIGLLNDLPGISEAVAKGAVLPDFDYHCPLLSLPLAFRTDLETIPGSRKYLNSDPLKVAQWSRRLGEKKRARAGLVWSGNARHTKDHNRSIPLSTMIGRLPEGFTYVCLQKEVREIDRVTLESNPDILHFGDELNDFTDTAALCDLMDLVISVDTSVAHLNGALGNPTWVLLPYSPDWRWMLDRNDSPWYPSMRLFRQPGPDDWESVFMELNSALTRVYGK
ncbi:MAG: tetratricopeptide repeat protein [Chlorobiaceae bacterium]|nr:tetratricopeptide repeat protein [Chlorobiaceae bacterium]